MTYEEARARYQHAPGDPDVHAALFAEVERLKAALREAGEALYNGFEPDNQSRSWHRVQEALRG